MPNILDKVNPFDNHTIKSSSVPVPMKQRAFIAHIKNTGVYYTCDITISKCEYGFTLTAHNVQKYVEGKPTSIKDLTVAGCEDTISLWSEFWARWSIFSKRVNGFKAYLEINSKTFESDDNFSQSDRRELRD